MNPAPLARSDTFAAEMATYERELPRLLGDVGRFVLIKGDEVVGIYDTYNDAVTAGYGRFKLEPFFVKQIAPAERIASFTRDLAAECP